MTGILIGFLIYCLAVAGFGIAFGYDAARRNGSEQWDGEFCLMLAAIETIICLAAMVTFAPDFVIKEKESGWAALLAFGLFAATGTFIISVVTCYTIRLVALIGGHAARHVGD